MLNTACTELWNSLALAQGKRAPSFEQEPKEPSEESPLWVWPCQPGTLSRQRNSRGWDLKKGLAFDSRLANDERRSGTSKPRS